MATTSFIGQQIASIRKQRGLRQIDLAAASGASRATIDALENGRAGDIGVSKLSRMLAVLGLELAIQPAPDRRPTLDELLNENSDD